MRVSILIMAFLPPFRALTSASSDGWRRPCTGPPTASCPSPSSWRAPAHSGAHRQDGRPYPRTASPRWSSRPGRCSAGRARPRASSWRRRAPAQQRDADDQQSRGEHEPPQGRWQRRQPWVSGDLSIGSSRLGSGLLVNLELGIAHLQSVLLDGGLGLSIASNGVLEGQTKVGSVSLKLLLHPESLSLALGL